MSTTLERLEYGFDRDSRRTWRKRSLTTGEDNAYGYDGLSQVVNAARGNLNLNATAIGGVPAKMQAWDYDPTGNWRGYETQTNGNVALDQSRVHDKGNRLTQIEGAPNPVLLDRAGRMREVSPDATGNWNQSQKITWDAWSRVVRIEQNGTTTGSYAYDGLTRRTTRTAGGVTWHSYYSDGWRPLEERHDSQTVPARQYYWGARHRDDLVRRDRATTSGGLLDEIRYVLMDYYSPAALTDETGTVKERYAFSAFGVRRILTPAFGDRATSECDFTFAFQGQFLDLESGFLNYGYRYYSPHLGRWLSKDPIQEHGGVNLYAYVLNKPTASHDLYGLSAYSDALHRAASEAYAKTAADLYEIDGFATVFRREFCGLICCKKGQFRHTTPHAGYFLIDRGENTVIPACDPYRIKGTENEMVYGNVNCSDLGEGWQAVGTYHSHPAGEDFSDSDRRWGTNPRWNPGALPMAVGTPKGVRAWDPRNPQHPSVPIDPPAK